MATQSELLTCRAQRAGREGGGGDLVQLHNAGLSGEAEGEQWTKKAPERVEDSSAGINVSGEAALMEKLRTTRTLAWTVSGVLSIHFNITGGHLGSAPSLCAFRPR